MAVKKELENFAHNLASVLKDNFIGFYITGSYVMGAWDPQKSDIDFFAVTKGPITNQESQKLVILFNKIFKSKVGKKLEGEIVDIKMLQKKEFTNTSGKISYGNFSVGPSNLSADNIACLVQFGKTIVGKPIQELNLHVSKQELDNAVLTMLKEDSAEFEDYNDFKTLLYFLLNMLRCIYTLETGKLPTKIIAIEHNKKLIGEKIHKQVRSYLNNEISEFPISKDKLKEIANYGLSLEK